MTKFKIGDRVICKPNYSSNHHGLIPYGGIGYTPHKVFTVRDIESSMHYLGHFVLWGEADDGLGVYSFAVEHYNSASDILTEEEINIINKLNNGI